MPVLAHTLLVQCRCFCSILPPVTFGAALSFVRYQPWDFSFTATSAQHETVPSKSSNSKEFLNFPKRMARETDSPAGVGLPKHSHLPNLGNPLHNSPRLVNEHNLLLPHVRNTYIIS
jgi:hypothetical protein